jgi:hypothetical protein
MAAKKTSTDARLSLERAFDAVPNLDAKFKKMLEELFTTEKVKMVWQTIVCPCCGKKRRHHLAIPVDDWNARVKALDLLLTQAKGKPAETKKLDVSITAAKTRQELENASEEDLLLLASGAADAE